MRKQTKKEERRKEKRRQPSKTSSFPFFPSSSLVTTTYHYLHKQKIKNKTSRRRFGALPALLQSLNSIKKEENLVMSPIALHVDSDMEQLLGNVENFEKLDQDPFEKIKKQ